MLSFILILIVCFEALILIYVVINNKEVFKLGLKKKNKEVEEEADTTNTLKSKTIASGEDIKQDKNIEQQQAEYKADNLSYFKYWYADMCDTNQENISFAIYSEIKNLNIQLAQLIKVLTPKDD